jgi:hypothetical protein
MVNMIEILLLLFTLCAELYVLVCIFVCCKSLSLFLCVCVGGGHVCVCVFVACTIMDECLLSDV